jgi:hypothetical protein
LVAAFQAGKYEDNVAKNATFAEGDWNGDGDFTTADLVYVFALGLYRTGAATQVAQRPARDLPAAGFDAIFAEWDADRPLDHKASLLDAEEDDGPTGPRSAVSAGKWTGSTSNPRTW